MSNQSAFLSMIGACEGADYDTLFGGAKFVIGADHPRRSVTAGGYTSTAAGRYQELAGTWDDWCRATGRPVGQTPFTAENQDACALWLIDRRGATQDVENGRLSAAIAKANREWASLPGSPYGQPVRSYAYCEQAYTAAGGVLNSGTTVPVSGTNIAAGGNAPDDWQKYLNPATAPINGAKGPTMGAALTLLPLLAQFIPQIMTLVKPGSQSTAKDAAVAQTILNTVVQAAGVVSNGPATAQSVGAAVDAMSADPALAKSVQLAVVTHPDVIGLLEIGGGLPAAREADQAAVNSDKIFLRSPAFWITILVFVPPIDFTVYKLVSQIGPPSENLITQVVTSILGLLAVIGAFYLGSSVGSQKKDDALAARG